jgi:hypothetical protein
MSAKMSALGELQIGVSRLIGLLFVVVGVAALMVGFFGWREASNPTVTALPAVTPAAVRPAQVKATPRSGTGLVSPNRTKLAVKAKARPVAKPPTATAAAPAAATAAGSLMLQRIIFWRRTMAWSGAALAIGLGFVGYSLRDRAKIIRSGADEMLNEPMPF